MNPVLIEAQAGQEDRLHNFCAGPAPLPQPVLERARDELLSFHGKGVSIMEVSHRGELFMEVAAQAEQDLRDLLAIPDHYKVLFLQGGARGQFAAIPLNLRGDRRSADYVNSGYWAQSAIKEAQRYLDVNVIADGKSVSFRSMPDTNSWHFNQGAAYVHYTPNETIGGLEFPYVPQTGDVPLIADMSSSILSKPLDVSQFGLIYAGAQKNIGPAGLTIAIVREDLLTRESTMCPAVLDYRLQAEKDSMYNTPPTFSWYLSGLVFQWLRNQGGLETIQTINDRKAKKLYAFIDQSGFYHNSIDVQWRSRMNVPFALTDPKLDSVFLRESEHAGFCYLKGHRAVGGMRASLYNAIPESHVDALLAFMSEFEAKYG